MMASPKYSDMESALLPCDSCKGSGSDSFEDESTERNNQPAGMTTLMKKFGKEMKEYMKTHHLSVSRLLKYGVTRDFENLRSEIKELSMEWKSLPVKVAVTGRAGTGKSSFINTIRNVGAEDEGAAPIGATETTTKVTPYPHPNFKDVIFYDLPGVGTPNFPQESYLKTVNYRTYDLFLILTDKRFYEMDMWLAEEVKKEGKPAIFIRTNVDTDIANDKRAKPRTHNEKKVLEDIRNNFVENQKTKMEVFLISNFDEFKYDFGLMNAHIIRELPRLQADALALSLAPYTDEAIEAKRNVMEQETLSDITFRFFNRLLRMGDWYFKNKVFFYKRILGLDDESLAVTCIRFNLIYQEIKGKLNNWECTLDETESSTFAVLTKLKKIQDHCVEDAETVHREILKKITRSVMD